MKMMCSLSPANHGLERRDQIKYAGSERSEGISIIPFDDLAAFRINT